MKNLVVKVMFLDYESVQTREGVSLTGNAVSGIKHFHFVEGLCAVDQQNPTNPRDRQWYVENVIALLLQEGKIGDGTKTPYDDRKFRLDGIEVKDDTLEIALGVSHYHLFLGDQERNDKDNRALQQKGQEDFNDEWAYFQRNPGIAGLVLSSTGSVYLGQRTNQQATGKLNAVAGHVKYRGDISTVNLIEDLELRLEEEMGIRSLDIVSMRFVGAYGHPIKGDFDFTWIVRTSLPDTYFSAEGAWHKRRKNAEHEDLIRFATPHEVKMLLDEGRIQGRNKRFEIMYSTRGALENLREGNFRSL